MDDFGALLAGDDLSIKYAAIAVSSRPNRIVEKSNFFNLGLKYGYARSIRTDFDKSEPNTNI